MTKIFIIILAVISNLAWFAALAVYPFIYVLKTGRFFKGVLRSWGFYLLGAILLSLFIPGALTFFLPEYKQFIYVRCFPEAPVIVATFFTGWLPACVICGIALAIRAVYQKYRTRAVPPAETDAR